MGLCAGIKLAGDEAEEEVKNHYESLHDFLSKHEDILTNPAKLHAVFVGRLKEFASKQKSKSESHNSFISKVIDSIEKAGHAVVTDFDSDMKETEQSIHKFIESNEEKFENMEKKAVDFIKSGADSLMISFCNGLMECLFGIEDLQIDAYHLWLMLCSIPIVGQLLPPPPKDLADVCPPTSSQDKFFNWALTVLTNPGETRVVTTRDDVLKLIQDSQKDEDNRKKVRVSGFKHSFSPLFSDSGEYIHGFLLPPELSCDQILDRGDKGLVFDANLKWAHRTKLPETTTVEILENNKLRVSCGASNYTYAKLAEKLLESGKPFPSEPTSVLQLFQGFPGTYAVACHGGGITATTLCDYITKLKVVDYKGEEVVYEGAVLKKIGAHLGLLGIVVEMEIQFDPPYLALFQPKYRKISDYFPENGVCEEFQNDVNVNYYNEFFWWPFADDVFVNCWSRTFEELDNYERLPSKTEMTWQETGEVFGQLFNQLIGSANAKTISTVIYSKLLSRFGRSTMLALKKPKRIPSFDALHFRHGIQNMRVFDLEFCFPLDELKDENGDKVLIDGHPVPDVSLVRDLVLAAIKLHDHWADNDLVPQLLPLEFRIVRGSDVILSPAHGSPFAVYIEVLTPTQGHQKWHEKKNASFFEYCQELLDCWCKIVGPEKMRPHWGKLWQMFKVGDKTIYEHLRETYKDDIAEFNKIREAADPHNVFMNEALGKIFLDRTE